VRRKRKENFEIPDSSLLGCGGVSTGKKATFHRKKSLTSSGSSSGKIMVYY